MVVTPSLDSRERVASPLTAQMPRNSATELSNTSFFWIILTGKGDIQEVDAELERSKHFHFIKHVEEELNVTAESDLEKTLLSAEDLPLLVETFSFLHFCSTPKLIEAVKLGTFLKKLLGEKNAKTLLSATVNTMLQGNVKSTSNKDILHQIFDDLDKVYNFMLGPSILALASTPQLRQMAKADFHFLEDYSQDIQHCLRNPNCNRMIDLTNGSAGKEKQCHNLCMLFNG